MLKVDRLPRYLPPTEGPLGDFASAHLSAEKIVTKLGFTASPESVLLVAGGEYPVAGVVGLWRDSDIRRSFMIYFVNPCSQVLPACRGYQNLTP